jgi:hypothetical protein
MPWQAVFSGIDHQVRGWIPFTVGSWLPICAPYYLHAGTLFPLFG